MGFDALLGNARLKENLTNSLSRGHISHFYLISGPAGSGKHTLAQLLAAAILCRNPQPPCGVCSVCRKVRDGNHPDVITVDDPEHKTVAVKIVRQYREDVFIRPNESDHKIYIFPQELGIEGQNALLKILEEPPAYGVFILLSDNPEKLLPTVRSRCTELTLQALSPELMRPALQQRFPDAASEDLNGAIRRSGGYLGQAIQMLADGDSIAPQTTDFVRCFAARDTLGLVQTLVPMEKWKRDSLAELLSSWVSLLEEAMACCAGMPASSGLSRALSTGRSARELLHALRSIQQALVYLQSNVSPAAVCGWLQWELR